MKTLLFILITYTSSFSASMYSNGKCVDYFDTSDTNRLYIEYSNGSTQNIKLNRANTEFLINNINKFYYENGQCKPILQSTTQMFMSSLMGILIGFTILFFSILITIKVGAKK